MAINESEELPPAWWSRTLNEIETDAIVRTLEDCSGDKKWAASRLGVSLKTIYNKLNCMADKKPAENFEDGEVDMSGVADARGPLRAAVQAVMLKAISEHGRGGAAGLTGISVRALHNWLNRWGLAPREEPEVPQWAVEELTSFLGIKTQITVQEVIQADCSLVQMVEMPDEIRQSIERATELLITGNHRLALQTLLEIELPAFPAKLNPTLQSKGQVTPCQ